MLFLTQFTQVAMATLGVAQVQLAARSRRRRLRSRCLMDRVITPLLQNGVNIVGEGQNHTAPLRIEGAPLKGIEYSMPIASAQVKGALLLAGLLPKEKPR